MSFFLKKEGAGSFLEAMIEHSGNTDNLQRGGPGGKAVENIFRKPHFPVSCAFFLVTSSLLLAEKAALAAKCLSCPTRRKGSSGLVLARLLKIEKI